ncbi:pyruvate dehydrogenase (acetyl-transferring) E1 component subunit alpha [Brevibacterium daeguense]|uniref:2-oxoisovalerate dehydrogenase subunit alpha n=1 Tax=Brevibacterium daeguense TaxID=909936 RepID=A0ABP8EFL8_9MICO|nr:thiamine pyrophosphate-dependent dehydrogenase E1 component subunit alpha [Brevibacterium daeguense]
MKRREILDPHGKLLDGQCPTLDIEQTVEALERMLLSKHVDERAFSLQRQGRMGTYSAVRGQEASVIGSCLALDPARDWIVPQYRELPALLRHGVTIEGFLSYWKGNSIAGRIPEGVKVLPPQIGLAAQLPHAVGLAWGLKLQNDPGVVMTFIGDGGSSEGDFHEALNLAGVMKAPVVFVLQNNGWAISTPRSKQTAAESFAARGPGYGVPSILVDGNDLFAVHQAAAEAVDRAQSGGGPTLIETQTYRLGAHNTADDPTKYVDTEEKLTWEELDPIPRVISYLKQQGAITDDAVADIEARNRAEVDRAVEALDEVGPPPAESLFQHVYSQMDPRLCRQRDDILKGADR